MTRFKDRDYSKTAQRSGANWIQADFPGCCFRSRLESIDGRKNISFFIDKAEITEKAEFKTKNGKKIPAHKAVKFTGSFVDESAQEQTVLVEFSLNDRYRVCNTMMNKLLFAIRQPEYDGFLSLGISATKDDKRRLWVDTFGDQEKRTSEQRDAFPFNEFSSRFEGVPEMLPIKNKKGEHMEKDGMKLYDTDEFDSFWLDAAEEICAFFDGE